VLTGVTKHAKSGHGLVGAILWSAADLHYPDYDGFTVYLRPPHCPAPTPPENPAARNHSIARARSVGSTPLGDTGRTPQQSQGSSANPAWSHGSHGTHIFSAPSSPTRPRQLFADEGTPPRDQETRAAQAVPDQAMPDEDLVWRAEGNSADAGVGSPGTIDRAAHGLGETPVEAQSCDATLGAGVVPNLASLGEEGQPMGRSGPDASGDAAGGTEQQGPVREPPAAAQGMCASSSLIDREKSESLRGGQKDGPVEACAAVGVEPATEVIAHRHLEGSTAHGAKSKTSAVEGGSSRVDAGESLYEEGRGNRVGPRQWKGDEDFREGVHDGKGELSAGAGEVIEEAEGLEVDVEELGRTADEEDVRRTADLDEDVGAVEDAVPVEGDGGWRSPFDRQNTPGEEGIFGITTTDAELVVPPDEALYGRLSDAATIERIHQFAEEMAALNRRAAKDCVVM
jgi:hypothetical protein